MLGNRLLAELQHPIKLACACVRRIKQLLHFWEVWRVKMRGEEKYVQTYYKSRASTPTCTSCLGYLEGLTATEGWIDYGAIEIY